MRSVFPWRPDAAADDFVAATLAGASGATRGQLFGGRSGNGSACNCELVYAPLRDNDVVCGGFAYVRDVTSEVRLVAVAQESEDRFRVMADHAPAYLWMSDVDGRCNFFNQEWLRFTGKTMQEEQGYGWAEGVYFEDFQRCVDTYMESFNLRRAFSMEYRLRRHDGQFRWVLDNGTPRFRSDGRFAGYIGSCIDITDIKAAHSERERLHAEERVARAEAERLYHEAQAANQVKDEFLATVSHELRTPMNAILGWASLLAAGDAPRDELARIYATVERNARAQARLIEDLLDVSKIVTGKLALDSKPVDLWPIVKQVVDSMSLSIEARQLRLIVEGAADVCLVSADATRLSQVIWNLISNAVKFTPPGGDIEVSLRRAGAQAVLTVKDSGEGIDPGVLPHIFERFRQADGGIARRHGGLGLGLAIVRHLVEMHGGQAEARSEGRGRGTTFIVKLPLIAVQRPSAGLHAQNDAGRAVHPASGDAQRLAGMRILAVDDSPDTLALLRALLKRYGAEVIPVGSVGEAMRAIDQFDPDVIVSDISMPDETGFDLLRKVQSHAAVRARRIPVAALTAHARNEEREQALNAGFHAYVAKPFDEKALVQTIAQLAGSRDGPQPC